MALREMAYSLDFRELAIRLVRENGESQTSVAKALATLKNWLKREDLTPNKPGPKRSHTLNRGALKEWVANEPDAYLDE